MKDAAPADTQEEAAVAEEEAVAKEEAEGEDLLSPRDLLSPGIRGAPTPKEKPGELVVTQSGSLSLGD